MLAAGIDNIVLPTEEAIQKVRDNHQAQDVNMKAGDRKWRYGELEFEAEMRTLDNAV